MHAPQSPANGRLQSRHSGLFAFSAGLLLLFMAFLAGGSALRESVTIDEVAHIGAGVSYLQKLDLRFNPEHPRSEERRVGKECRSRWSPYH